MLVTNHVLSGAAIGAASGDPARAFFLGVASHFALDAIPHWGVRERRPFLRVAVADGLTGLAAIAAVAAAAPPGRRAAVLAGIAGAVLPDLDKPSRLFFGGSPFPRMVDHFHRAIQRESPHRLPHEAGAAVILGVTMLAVFRSRRPRRRPPGAGGSRAPRQRRA